MAYFNANSDVDLEHVPITDRPKEYTIYVSNLPEELNEDAIREIFSPYGNITGMFYRCNTTWTYITYKTFREAEHAIRELNNKKPLYLNVALAKERSNPKQEIQQLNSVQEMRMSTTTEPAFHNNIKYQPQSTRHGQKRSLLNYSVPHDSETSNIYDDSSSACNRLWTRGVVTVTADGKRHVSLGRGYKLYEIPDPCPSNEERIKKIHMIRNSQLYEYSEDKLKDGMQKCTVCCIKTTKHCEKCHTYYCSRTCQISDWQRHQIECERIPALVEDVNVEDEHVSESHTANFTAYNVTLRRPNTPIHSKSSHNTDMRSNATNDAVATSISTECNRNQKECTSAQHSDNSNIVPSAVNTNTKNYQAYCSQQVNIRTKENIDQLKSNNDKQDDKKMEACNAKEIAKQDENAICINKTTKVPAKVNEDFKFIPNTNVKTTANQLPNILDALADNLSKSQKNELKVTGVIQIFNCAKKVYTATFVPRDFIEPMEQIVTQLPIDCTELYKPNVEFKLKVGDLICGETESDIWYRGYVSTLSPKIQIALVDEGRILPVGKILPYPEKFAGICTFGVTCEITNVELKLNDVYEFSGIMKQHSHNRESLEIKIIVDTGLFTAVVKPWKFIPNIITNWPEFTDLKNDSKVCLTSYRNHYVMFARSLEEVEVERYNCLMQDVARCANVASYLTEPPKVNQVVITRFCDDNYYRAIITKIHDNDKVTIVYIDYGNEEERNVKELRQAPEKYQKERSCVTKIKLKDVPYNAVMNVNVDAYLRNLVGKDISLTCTFEDKLESGVHLTISPTGENVNEKIKQLLIPDWKQENDDNTCYMMDSLEVASLGRVGDTIDALVLFEGHANELSYMLAPYDIELIRYITETLSKLLKEYAEKTEYYIPRKQELCLALYDGDWYRALCINPNLNQTECEIFFVDYGNIESIEHKYIRLMPKDFIVPAAMANICKVINLAPVDSVGNYSSNVKQKIKELMPLNQLAKVKIVSYCVKSGEYKIELPEIHAALIKEGLVPSV